MQRLSDIQNMVLQLYEAIHCGEQQLRKERQLAVQLQELQSQLIPLEQVALSSQKLSNFSFFNTNYWPF